MLRVEDCWNDGFLIWRVGCFILDDMDGPVVGLSRLSVTVGCREGDSILDWLVLDIQSQVEKVAVFVSLSFSQPFLVTLYNIHPRSLSISGKYAASRRRNFPIST